MKGTHFKYSVLVFGTFFNNHLYKLQCVCLCVQDRCFSVLCVRRGSPGENSLQSAEVR